MRKKLAYEPGPVYWNYRVIRVLNKYTKQVEYGIYEVFYSPRDRPIYRTQEPSAPYGEETPSSLTDDWKLMAQAFERSVLSEKDFQPKRSNKNADVKRGISGKSKNAR